jgi:hypothetical protein
MQQQRAERIHCHTYSGLGTAAARLDAAALDIAADGMQAASGEFLECCHGSPLR